MTPSLIFQYDATRALRVMEQENEPWFCAADVCVFLDIANSRDAAARLPDEEKMTVGFSDGNPRNGKPLQLTYVSEAGLYRLIFRSNKAEAKKFQDWVFREVLPSIRKHGRYAGTEPTLDGPPEDARPLHRWVEEFLADKLPKEHLEPGARLMTNLAACLRTAARDFLWYETAKCRDAQGFALVPARVWWAGVRRWMALYLRPAIEAPAQEAEAV